jgi:hypothetical protein
LFSCVFACDPNHNSTNALARYFFFLFVRLSFPSLFHHFSLLPPLFPVASASLLLSLLPLHSLFPTTDWPLLPSASNSLSHENSGTQHKHDSKNRRPMIGEFPSPPVLHNHNHPHTSTTSTCKITHHTMESSSKNRFQPYARRARQQARQPDRAKEIIEV